LIGNNNFESGFYQVLAFATGQTFTDSQQAAFNLEGFTCASGIDAANRAAQGVPVYRYRYYGDFANLRLFPGSGTYHGAELNMVFGTAEDVSGLPNDDVEIKTIAYFQKAWATFARNPSTGLLTKLGWPLYKNTTGKQRSNALC
jgi:carboxylesterase type B